MNVAALRDLVRLRTRLRSLRTLYLEPTAPPPLPPRDEVDPARLAAFARFNPEAPGHAEIFLRDSQALFGPALGDREHLTAALDWLLRAQAATNSGGFSVGYSFAHRWFPAYPETTGYIIPTFWEAFRRTGDARYEQAAIAAADWEIDIQLPSGAVKAGYEGPDPDGFWTDVAIPSAFNTGQVMQGWNRTFLETRDPRYLTASRRAAEFLASCIDDRGVFVAGLSPGPLSRTRAYYARAAYGLVWTGLLVGECRYIEAASRHLDWVVGEQRESGWVAHANFGSKFDDDAPLTHTLAYTAEGLLDAGLLLSQPKYVDASRRLAEAVMRTCERRGLFLPATLTERFTSRDRFACLPGNAQFAALWLRHGMLTADLPLTNSGLKMVDWLKGVQSLDNENDGIRGGLAASWPIDGGYSVFFFVNWAAKFFADALMLAEDAKAKLRAVG